MARSAGMYRANLPAAGSTSYYVMAFGARGGSNESRSPIYWPAGTFSHLATYVNAYTASAPYTVRSRVAGADGNMTLSLNGTGLFEDASGTDVVTASQLVSVYATLPAGTTGSATWSGFSFQFDADDGNAAMMYTFGDWWGQTDDTTRYAAVGMAYEGNGGATTVDAVQHRIGCAGTMGRLQTNIRSNTKSEATTYTVLVNGSASDLAVSVGASATGRFEDATAPTTISIADGDLVALEMNPGGATGNITTYCCAVGFWSSSAIPLLTGMRTDGSAPSVGYGSTYYGPVSAVPSGATQWGTTNADFAQRWHDGGTISEPSAYISAFNLTGTNPNGRVTLMVDGVATDVVITFTGTGRANGTGSATVPAGSYLSWRYDCQNATAGQWTPSQISAVMEFGGAPAAPYLFVRRRPTRFQSLNALLTR